ncbi:MAG: 30S ribosomal protein S11 [Elusimicrobia bacterium]|nr:30S ribosomal protein S11 [Elusimicrobiota bacterium]
MATTKNIVKKGKRKRKIKIDTGVVYIKSTFNNTIVSITDETGCVLTWASAGSIGMKGSRKGTAYAGGLAAQEAAKKAIKENGIRNVIVKVKGPGSSRETAIRSLEAQGLEILSVQDITPVPHNGCRSARPRRV